MTHLPLSSLQRIPSGPAGTRQTLNIMRSLTRAGKKTPAVRQTAVVLTQGLPQKDYYSEILALYNFVRDRIRYVRDIRDVETLHTPELILQNKQGDCDDKSVLLASLLESLGHRTQFVAVGFQPNRYSHVLVEVFNTKTGQWLPLETTEPVEPGWQPKNIRARMVVSNDSNPSGIGSLAGKRVQKVLARQAAAASAAQAAAAAPDATDEQRQYAADVQEAADAGRAAFSAKQATKKKGFAKIVQKVNAVRKRLDPVAKTMAFTKAARKDGFKSALKQETATLKQEHTKGAKIMASLGSPSFKKHAKFLVGQERAKELKTRIVEIQAQRAVKDSRFLQEQEQSAYGELKEIADFQKKYIKQGKIVAAIASLVVGFFTFGGGTAAIQSAVQALKEGAIALAKKILLGAVAQAVAKGGSKKDADEAKRAINALEQYPPNPELNDLDSMVQDSYDQQKEAQSKSLGWIIPLGLFALTALT